MGLLLWLCVGCGDRGGESGAPGNGIMGIGLAPYDPVAVEGDTVAFQARAYFEDASFEDVTDQVSWSVDEERVATVDDQGVATALEMGTAVITARLADPEAESTVTLTVREPGSDPVSLLAEPAALVLEVGEEAPVAIRAAFEDGGTGNVAGTCSWSSDALSVATVGSSGMVRGVAQGSTTVTAECAGGAVVVPVEVGSGGGGKPDLVVDAFAAVAGGGDVSYAVTIRNVGQGNAMGFYLDLFLDRASAPQVGSTYDETVWVGSLAAGAGVTIELDVYVPGSGELESWVFVDPEDAIDESNEGNNVRGPVDVSLGGGPPDIEIAAFEALTDGVDTYFTIEVRNSGDSTAFGFWVDLFYDRWTDPDLCEYGDAAAFVDALGPGESIEFEHFVEDAPSWLDAWDSVLVVDTCDDVLEEDEKDNLAWIEIE